MMHAMRAAAITDGLVGLFNRLALVAAIYSIDTLSVLDVLIPNNLRLKYSLVLCLIRNRFNDLFSFHQLALTSVRGRVVQVRGRAI